MSHKHKVKIEKLFEHPISANIEIKKILSALEHYGCHIEISKQGKAKITFNDEEFSLSLSHGHDLSKDSVVHLRNFLESVGLTPDNLD